ncbi:MAG: killer suppression protein [Magnetococcales bacterium]|nr:killer suppression protein [Magnetococcales bacterium]
MEIVFRNRKLAKQCGSMQSLQKAYGEKQARFIARRLNALRAAAHLGEFWPPHEHAERCHELKANRTGQLSMDLDHPYRLIFKPANNPVPQRPDGGIDWHRVTAITIINVEDPHE